MDLRLRFDQRQEYNIFRWYRAGWGRYTQGDPLGLAGGVNLYRYGDDDPVSNFDPLGQKVCRCDRRLAATPLVNWWNPLVNSVAHHSFVKIVDDQKPCDGIDGIAWGLQTNGRVEPESTPTFNAQVHCSAIPCIDEQKLRQNINRDLRQPPGYSVCRIGRGKWNSGNCQGWADDILRRSASQTCCLTR